MIKIVLLIYVILTSLCACGRIIPDLYGQDPTGVNEVLPSDKVRQGSKRLHWRANSDCLRMQNWTNLPTPGARREVRETLWDFCEQNKRDQDKDLIALTISGGGAKAAIFGGESMFYLDALGLLPHVDMLSAVSGGSIPAAYFALSCDQSDDACASGAGAKRPPWRYKPAMEVISSGFIPMIQAFAENALMAPALATWPVSARYFAGFINQRFFGGADAVKEGFLFRDLNPRRPWLVLNATVASKTRGVAEENIGSGFLRRRTTDEFFHFAFTDYYFRRIGSDLSSFPLSYAVASSSAFPPMIGYGAVQNFNWLAQDFDPLCYNMYPNSGVTWVNCITTHDVLIHDAQKILNANRNNYQIALADGGNNDNQGLIEVLATLAEVIGSESRSDSHPKPFEKSSDRALVLVLNSSVTEAAGGASTAGSDSNLGLEDVLSRLYRAVDVYSAVSYTLRRRLYDAYRRVMNRKLGAKEDHEGAGPVNSIEIGLVTLSDYKSGGIERAAEQAADVSDKTVDNPEVRNERIVRERSFAHVFGHYKDLALSPIHPQCLFEQAKVLDSGLFTLAKVDPKKAVCLRHAARWATALRMDEICQERSRYLWDRNALPCKPVQGSVGNHLMPDPGVLNDLKDIETCDMETANTPSQLEEIRDNLIAEFADPTKDEANRGHNHEDYRWDMLRFGGSIVSDKLRKLVDEALEKKPRAVTGKLEAVGKKLESLGQEIKSGQHPSPDLLSPDEAMELRKAFHTVDAVSAVKAICDTTDWNHSAPPLALQSR